MEIRDLLALVTRDQIINRRRAYDSHVRPIIDLHLLPELGKIKASLLRTDHIDAYRDKKSSEGLEHSTINRHLTVLLRAYKLAYDREPPLVDRIPKICKSDESDNVRDICPTEAEFQALINLTPLS